LLAAGAALSGGLPETVMEPDALAEQSASSSGGLLVPLFLLALLAVVSSGGSTPVPLPN
jgi:hypothetical protein